MKSVLLRPDSGYLVCCIGLKPEPASTSGTSSSRKEAREVSENGPMSKELYKEEMKDILEVKNIQNFQFLLPSFTGL